MEVRAIYDDDRARFLRQGGFGDLAPEAQQARERRNSLYGTDDREFRGRPKGLSSGFLRLRAEHPPHSVIKPKIAQGFQQTGAVGIAGGLTAAHKDRQGATPTTAISLFEAALLKRSGSRIIVRPASTARHVSPEAAMLSMVFLPMTGRS